MTSREIGPIFPDRSLHTLQVSFPRLKSMVEIFSDEEVETLIELKLIQESEVEGAFSAGRQRQMETSCTRAREI